MNMLVFVLSRMPKDKLISMRVCQWALQQFIRNIDKINHLTFFENGKYLSITNMLIKTIFK